MPNLHSYAIPVKIALQQAIAYQQSGRLREAQELYRDILKKNPAHGDAHRNLLVLFYASGRIAEMEQQALAMIEHLPKSSVGWKGLGLSQLLQGKDARHAFQMATKYVPDDAEAHDSLGLALKRAGQLEDAETSFRRAIKFQPKMAGAHVNLANVLKDRGQLNDALASYKNAIVIQPDLAEAHYNMAGVLRSLHSLEDAVKSYRQALRLKPDWPEAHYNLGAALHTQGFSDAAQSSYREALKFNPDFVEAHSNLGGVLRDIGQLEEALASYRRAVEIDPEFAEAHYNLGILFGETNHPEEAEASYRRAVQIEPNYAEAYNNLGNTLRAARRLEEAELAHLRALEINPESAQAHSNMGLLQLDARRPDAAEVSYRRALEIQPDYPEAVWNLSLLLLAQGRYSEAWPLHESRYDPRKKDSNTKIPILPCPQWGGEPLTGKSILIWPEQGFGDLIQFVRFAPLLKNLGVSQLTVFCAAPLKPLLETVTGVDAVITDADSFAPHDFWTFPLSLPLHFGTTIGTIPNTLPYLCALPTRLERWRGRLPAQGFKVGLVWKGSPLHKNDINRSLPGLSTLAPLWTVPGITFVSLQQRQAEDEAVRSDVNQPLIHLGTEIADFADTAAIVAQLDLVICVDTAIAHLVGALGKPCWILLPAIGTDWRWMLDRAETPWYPGVMRLFRQVKPDDWSDIICDMTNALQHRVIDSQC